MFSETELRLKHLIELETTPFTLNNHYYEATLEKVRADLNQQRQLLDKSESPAKKVAMPTVDVAKATPEQPRDLLPPTPAPSTAIAVPNGFSFTFKEQSKEPEKSKGEQEKLRAALAALAALGYNVQEEDLPKLLPPDEFADELDVMSHVMANWKVRSFVLSLLSKLTPSDLRYFPGRLQTYHRQRASIRRLRRPPETSSRRLDRFRSTRFGRVERCSTLPPRRSRGTGVEVGVDDEAY